ncbi:MAG: hypothetical protein AAF587_05125 [Bacteroidota bacterium]
MKSSFTETLKNTSIGFALILAIQLTVYGQNDSTELSDLERTFMPAIQMGYVHHGTAELSGGLMIQTSIEYRDISNFIFRLNYDDFNSSITQEYPISPEISFTGKTSFSELIVGIGYRHSLNKHHITGYIQPGARFYGYPVFHVDSNQVQLDFNSRNIGMIRYSIGYEYMLAPRLFFTIEALASHVLKSIDYWADNRWSYGITLGISAPLF